MPSVCVRACVRVYMHVDMVVDACVRACVRGLCMYIYEYGHVCVCVFFSLCAHA